ncbi:MAG TPA: hypothetical protein VD866_02070 [Urbifossiella sp.]|nr:hypothetical protein [Urbifossiella sp.]
MTTREEIEAEIRQVLATETRAVELSHALFEQGTGLFSRLAATEEERRVVSESPLFTEAQRRFTDLMYAEAVATPRRIRAEPRQANGGAPSDPLTPSKTA